MEVGQPDPGHHGRVRRTPLLVIGWLAAGAAAVGAASAGVAMVSDQVTESRPAPLNAAEVAQELAEQPSTTAAPSSTTTETTPTSSPPTTAVGPPAPTTTVPPPPTTAPAIVRTYSLVGGTATLRFSAAGVTVVTATPNAGFDVEVEPEHGNGVKVEFERQGHKSRVSGWWDGGPRDEVREEADD